MAGLMIFKTLSEAVRNGFEIYDRTSDGYIVRARTDRGWAMALVTTRNSAGLPDRAFGPT